MICCGLTFMYMDTEVRQNYYDILEVNPNASQHEIEIAYEKAKLLYSTDNRALASLFTVEEASQLRQLVEEAYQALAQDFKLNVYKTRVAAAQSEVSLQELTAEVFPETQTQFERILPPKIELKTQTEQQATILPVNPQKNLEFENSLAQKKDWLGEDLKEVREYRQLSFDELTDITKINPWYIASIEKMDPSNLPVEVFVRGYVLQIAKALGLKEKAVADSYMRHFRKKIENS